MVNGNKTLIPVIEVYPMWIHGLDGNKMWSQKIVNINNWLIKQGIKFYWGHFLVKGTLSTIFVKQVVKHFLFKKSDRVYLRELTYHTRTRRDPGNQCCNRKDWSKKSTPSLNHSQIANSFQRTRFVTNEIIWQNKTLLN